jgi:hypothetical protein
MLLIRIKVNVYYEYILSTYPLLSYGIIIINGLIVIIIIHLPCRLQE